MHFQSSAIIILPCLLYCHRAGQVLSRVQKLVSAAHQKKENIWIIRSGTVVVIRILVNWDGVKWFDPVMH